MHDDAPGTALGGLDDPFVTKRNRLVDEIVDEVQRTAKWTGCAHLDARVLAALSRVPRHAFVPEEALASAYANRPLGIGHGQTISQPFIVALMTDCLGLDGSERVLEIGTGSGYQTAVLAELAAEVYSVEVVPSLAASAERVLGTLGYINVRFRVANGRDGWPEAGPFPAIMVTAAADSIPETLTAQLAPGGRMILPVGQVNGPQHLVRVTRDSDGTLSKSTVLPVSFVPLVGGT